MPAVSTTPSVTAGRSVLDLYHLGEAKANDSWLVSDWSAGQTTIMDWSRNNVRVAADGAIELLLDDSAQAAGAPFRGGEIQSAAVATTGTWTWTAQAPRMTDGAVFGMFLYKADWQRQPWLEYDFEFVGKDTTRVQLAVHMVDADGRHVTNRTPLVIELGFDASERPHTYAIVLDGTSALFQVDGRNLARVTAEDMPGGIWRTGPLKSYVDLWAADVRHVGWTGRWSDPAETLVARIEGATVQPGVVPGTSGPVPILGTDRGETLHGTSGDDILDARGGNDTIAPGAGHDRVQGGEGADSIHLDAGNDIIDGGQGRDGLRITGATPVTVDLSMTTAQDTGYGLDTLNGIEDAAGGSGNDRLSGDSSANVLCGGRGRDLLAGRAGADTLEGGAGRDHLSGGPDLDRDVFVFRSTSESAVGADMDVIQDFVAGCDLIDLRGIDAWVGKAGNQAFGLSHQTPQAHSLWIKASGRDLIVCMDVNGNLSSDMQIRLTGVGPIDAGDILL